MRLLDRARGSAATPSLQARLVWQCASLLLAYPDEYLAELRQAARSAGTPLERLHLIVDTAAAYFGARGHFRSLLRQMQGGSAILGPVLDAFAEDVYGRYAQALSLSATGDAAWLSDDVPELLGRPARSFEQFATDYARAFG